MRSATDAHSATSTAASRMPAWWRSFRAWPACVHRAAHVRPAQTCYWGLPCALPSRHSQRGGVPIAPQPSAARAQALTARSLRQQRRPWRLARPLLPPQPGQSAGQSVFRCGSCRVPRQKVIHQGFRQPGHHVMLTIAGVVLGDCAGLRCCPAAVRAGVFAIHSPNSCSARAKASERSCEALLSGVS